MDSLLSSIHHHIDPFDIIEAGRKRFEPVRIAILDSGFDPENPLLMTENQRLDPRIKAAQSFIHQTEPYDVRDEIGHGTHALGLLLKVATCAEIYIARIAHRETLDRSTYDDIAKASAGSMSKSTFWAEVNCLCRPLITQFPSGKWTSYRCHSGFVNIASQ